VLLAEQIIRQIERSLNIAFNIEVVVNVRFANRQFAGIEKHSAQRLRVLQDQREARLLDCAPRAPIPQPNLKIAPRTSGKQLIQEAIAETGRKVTEQGFQ
jgi:hypothetical protein